MPPDARTLLSGELPFECIDSHSISAGPVIGDYPDREWLHPDSTGSNDSNTLLAAVQRHMVTARFRPFRLAAMIRPQMDFLADSRFKVASEGPAAAYAGWLLRSFGAAVEHQSKLDEDGLGLFLAQGASFVREFEFTNDPNVTWITDAPVTGESRATLEALATSSQVIWVTPW